MAARASRRARGRPCSCWPAGPRCCPLACTSPVGRFADNGRITATVEVLARKAPKEVVLRFRHPKAAPIRSVTVNGQSWTEFNKGKETITLKGPTGTVGVTAQY